MELIADILLISGALGATAYCVVLSRRLRRFTDLEKGVGGAIAVLSAQVDDMTATLRGAQSSALGSAQSLAELTDRAEGAAKRLELLVASMHDLPKPAPDNPPPAGTGPGTGADGAAVAEADRPIEGMFMSRRSAAGRAAE